MLLHGLDQLDHGVPEARALAGRETQSERMIGTLEIVNVEPVIRDRKLGRQTFSAGPRGGCLPHARRSGDEKIETRRFYLQTELQGLDSTLLPNRAVQRLEFLSRLKRQFRRVAEPSQSLGRHAPPFHPVAAIRSLCASIHTSYPLVARRVRLHIQKLKAPKMTKARKLGHRGTGDPATNTAGRVSSRANCPSAISPNTMLATRNPVICDFILFSLLRKSTTKKRRTRRKNREDLRALRFFVVDFDCF